MPIKIDGNQTSKKRLALLKKEIEKIYQKTGKRPGLAVIRVGEDPASKIYVSKKIQRCEEIGIHSIETHLPVSTSEKELLKAVDKLNEDKKIHGILIQLPLPDHIDVDAVLNEVKPEKDVDGFHPMNLGALLIRKEGFVACTPKGIMSLLEDYDIPLEGKRAVVVGRSRIVGRPMSLLLDHAGATVTVVHSKTKRPKEITKQADILVVAAGVKEFIRGEDIKKEAVVIDVGMHRNTDGSLCGDVKYAEAAQMASAITPVPGGVGPMTICSLLENTFDSFKRSL